MISAHAMRGAVLWMNITEECEQNQNFFGEVENDNGKIFNIDQ